MSIMRHGLATLLFTFSSAFAHAANPQLLVAEANNHFGQELFKYLQAEQPLQNLVFSPFSAFVNLSLVYNGAAGATRDQIADALQARELNLSDFNTGATSLLSALQASSNGFTFENVQSLWTRKDLTLSPSFQQRIAAYGATTGQLDFAGLNATNTINQWAAQATHNRILQILNGLLPQDTSLMVLNATYLKARWSTPFKAEHTQEAAFHTTATDAPLVKMMMRTGRMKYLADAQLESVELSYGSHEDASFVVLLPRPGVQSSSIPALTTWSGLSTWLRALSESAPKEGRLRLPKFTVEASAPLTEALKDMGLKEAFTERADFSELSDVRSMLSRVMQKAYVSVDEQGTEAAAVTSTTMVATAMPSEPLFEMRVDRPFVFIIRNNSTNAILFMGSIVRP